MSRIIYNEGRVVGLSAYEIFVKHAIAAGIDPGEVPSEQAWLSSCVAMGSSLILYIPTGTSAITNFALPSDSTLAAANTIIGSLFNGTGAYSGSGAQWVTSITSYGTNDSNNIPQPADFSTAQVDNYLKIVDGNINQSGVRTSNTLEPDVTSTGSATISIRLKSETTDGFYLLLTGFTDKSVLAGTVGTDGNQQTTSNKPNGDFIGPEVFPWSAKIIFTVPTAATSAVVNQGLDISAETNGGISVSHTPYTTSTSGKEEYKIGTLIDEGSGITIANGTGANANHKIISANIAEDSGITITDVSGTTQKKISANLSAGSGIVLTHNLDGSIAITNTGNSETGFITLTNGTDFDCTGYNGFYNSSGNTLVPKVSVRLYLEKNTINHFTANAFYKSDSVTQQNFRNMVVSQSDWNNGDYRDFYKITKCDLHIAGTYEDSDSQTTYVLHNPDFIASSFRFSHGLDMPSWDSQHNTYIWGQTNNVEYEVIQNTSSTWDSTNNRYMKNSGGQYEFLTSQPTDWEQNYSSYYIFTNPTRVRYAYQSYIFGIKFKNQFTFLNSGESGYNDGFYAGYMDATGSTNGLWNVTTTPQFVRASWYATYSISRPGVPSGSESKGYKPGNASPQTDGNCIFIVSGSYADGFNRQFFVYQHPSAGGATIVEGASNQLNMNSKSVQAEFTSIRYPTS